MKFAKCPCSRCKLYLTHSSDGTDGDHLENQEKEEFFEHREYQHYLLELAKKRNIIACLPTGSGKTFIAYKLIEHFKDDILTKSKKVFFLANTIPLVNQQAAFFARHTILAVKHITGDMEVDYWSEEKWQSIIDTVNVMAMTAQIFLNLIRHGFIKFSQVALIIFDECHHAVKEHPMNQIMREYDRTKKSDSKYTLPRVLGLTATIIKGNCKPHEVSDRVTDLENIMDADAATYKDYEEVMKNSTNAKVDSVSVDNCKRSEWYPPNLLEEIKLLSSSLQAYRKERQKLKAALARVPIDGIHSTLRNSNCLYLTYKKPSPGDLKTAVDDVRHAYEELGPYCAVIAINLRLAFIDFSLMDLHDGAVREWYKKVKKFLINMRDKLTELMAVREESERVYHYISPKLNMLIDIICKFRPPGNAGLNKDNDDKTLCGLVFVDRRATAQVLAWYFKDLSALSSEINSCNIDTDNNKKFSFIRANFVVGTSRCPFETVESRVYAKKQTETINQFRRQELNILIATSVLEEGIDVPSCNLVIRFDPIPTYTSYIQSMGRARKKDALFKILLSPEIYWRETQKIETYKDIHQRLLNHLQRHVQKVDSTPTKQHYGFPVDAVPPLCPGETPDSPRITMDSAHEVVDWYCMLLPCDGVSTLQTISWFQEQTDQKFKGFLKLPMNSAVTGAIDGIPMISQDLAKQAVFLEAAKRMHAAGILDENLVPVRPKFPAIVEAFFNRLLPTYEDDKEDGEIPDIEKKPEWYPKHKPEVLFGTNEKISVNKKYRVVRVCIRESTISESYKWQNLYRLQECNIAFGLVSNIEIPHVGDFPLFGEFGSLTVSLKKCNNLEIKMSESELTRLIAFQEAIFSDILAIKHSLMKTIRYKDHSLLVVPLIKVNGVWGINENILKKDDGDKINALFSCQMLRPPASHQKNRRRSYQSFEPSHTPPKMARVAINYEQKYKDLVVVPWYKKRPKPLYFVDSVANDLNPLSSFHEGEFTSYKDFYKKECKTTVLDDNQPLLKCKLSGVGLQNQQLNYLLKKYTKEDEFPVYLVPELCHILPVPASFIVQCKLLPSVLHRLSRLLLAQEMIREVGICCGWKGALVNVNDKENTGKEILALNLLHEDQSKAEEERRILRMTMRNRIKPKDKPIVEVPNIENRELHYEFIHPNKITSKDIRLFHEAVSIQHAAKNLNIDNDVDIIDAELSSPFKMDLIPIEDIVLQPIDKLFDLETTLGPSHLSVMEAISLRSANEGLSNSRYKMIGMSFLNYAVSVYCFINFPEWNEPLMCQLRNKLVSLAHICALAKKKNIAEKLSGSDFHPNLTWMPPGKKLQDGLGEIAAAEKVHLGVYDKIKDNIHSMSDDELRKHVSTTAPLVLATPPVKNKPTMKFTTFTHSEVSDISLASGVNALVGAFFTQCGPSGAFKFLEWIDFQAPTLNKDRDERRGEYLNYQKTKEIAKIYSSNETLNELTAIQRLLPGLEKFENLIGYRFNDKKNILEAFTHPSYPANDVSGCYQRLEFLGDSLLDLLITNHVYTLPQLPDHKLTEVQLVDICLALVNNVTYASLAVRYDFHKHLLSMSQALTDMIDNFIVYQEAAEHQVIGHFTLISDEECMGPKHVEVPKVLGDIFEAVAGAIYMDSGKSLDTVWKVYYRLMQNEIDNFIEVKPKSPIHALKEKFGDQLELTRWTSKKLKSRGREMCKISVGPYGHYYGCGTSIGRAKFAASKIALKMIKEEDEFVKDRDASKIMLLM